MPTSLQPAVDRYNKECNTTLEWLSATEALWIYAPPTTAVRQQLKVPQLEALYEAAFLRIFTAWEVVLEELTIRMMARAATQSWTPVAAGGNVLYQRISDSRQALYGTRDYMLWHDPMKVANRIAGRLNGSPLEAQVRASAVWLKDLSYVRHRIAHASNDAVQKFEPAALALTGTTYRGSPGRLLRSLDNSDPLNPARWILRFDTELRSIVNRSIL